MVIIMSINKFGAAQQRRDELNKNVFEGQVPKFTDDELVILQKLEQMCIEKGINEDALIDKVVSYRK